LEEYWEAVSGEAVNLEAVVQEGGTTGDDIRFFG